VKALVAGWFSFEGMGATAGDLIARDVVRDWLEQSSYGVDLACAPPFTDGIDWRGVEPDEYALVVFVCGPLGNGPPVDEFLDRFRNRALVGIDLTMLHRIEDWNPFDLLLERDSSRTARPDLVFAAAPQPAPVVGLVLMHNQPEYGANDLHASCNRTLEQAAASIECARVRIDTRLDENSTELRTPNEITALIARSDVVLTTRLHGLVLGLRSGVPVIAIDPVAGGAKITRQAGRLEWPFCFPADVGIDDVRRALDECLSNSEVRERASAVAKAARSYWLDLSTTLTWPRADGDGAGDSSRTG
jgi:hypothetical protein